MDPRALALAAGVAGALGYLSHPLWFVLAGLLFAWYGAHLVRWLTS